MGADPDASRVVMAVRVGLPVDRVGGGVVESVARGALSGIGNTPLVELVRVVPPGSARVMVKFEFANPTGSMKDRMARSAIEGAASDGRLQPGDTVVEYTAGTTGVSLAFVCAALGYGLHIVFSDAFSREKFLMMRAFGAVVEEIPSDGGQINEALIESMIARAGELACEPGRWWCDQLNNHDAIRGYAALGDEIWLQTGGSHRRVRPIRGHRPLDPRGRRRDPRPRSRTARDRGRTGRVTDSVRRTHGFAPHRGNRHWVHSAAVGAPQGRRDPDGQLG